VQMLERVEAGSARLGSARLGSARLGSARSDRRGPLGGVAAPIGLEPSSFLCPATGPVGALCGAVVPVSLGEARVTYKAFSLVVRCREHLSPCRVRALACASLAHPVDPGEQRREALGCQRVLEARRHAWPKRVMRGRTRWNAQARRHARDKGLCGRRRLG